MLITAVLSAFVSNTATTAMMLPIALSVVALLNDQKNTATAAPRIDEARSESRQRDTASDNLSICLLLGIAYAASLGGVATTIGTPTNAIVVGFLRDQIAEPYRMEISMARWLLLGVPLTAVFLPIVLFMLTKCPVSDKHAEHRRVRRDDPQPVATIGTSRAR